MKAWARQNRLDLNKSMEDAVAWARTPNVCSPGFSRFVWRFTSKVSLHELAPEGRSACCSSASTAREMFRSCHFGFSARPGRSPDEDAPNRIDSGGFH